MGDRPFVFEAGVGFVEWGTDLLWLKPELEWGERGTDPLRLKPESDWGIVGQTLRG